MNKRVVNMDYKDFRSLHTVKATSMLLQLKEKPLSFDELVEKVGMNRGRLSTLLKILNKYNLLEIIYEPSRDKKGREYNKKKYFIKDDLEIRSKNEGTTYVIRLLTVNDLTKSEVTYTFLIQAREKQVSNNKQKLKIPL